MTQLIEIPLSYIVFDTDYTARINKQKLMEELSETNIKPLYVYDTLWGQGRTLLTLEPNEQELTELQEAVSFVIENDSGTIAFKVHSMYNIFTLYRILKDLEYCAMFDIEDIQFVETTILGQRVNFAIVEVDSESG